MHALIYTQGTITITNRPTERNSVGWVKTIFETPPNHLPGASQHIIIIQNLSAKSIF